MPTATTATETATPTVARVTPSRMLGRTARQSVVRPPSARMIASAPKPSAWASSASENWIAKGPASPRSTPINR